MRSAPGSDLALARQNAHRAFDPLWQSGKMSRSAAYRWLSAKLHVPVEQCHMLLFDVAQCQRVVDLCVAMEFE